MDLPPVTGAGPAAERFEPRRAADRTRAPSTGAGPGPTAAYARAGGSRHPPVMSAHAPQPRCARRPAEPGDVRHARRSGAASTRPASTGSPAGTTSTRRPPPAARCPTSRRSPRWGRCARRPGTPASAASSSTSATATPAQLAKAAMTLDHISGGRFELGLGAGWHELEATAYGYDFPSIGTRFDMLEEAFPLIRSLLTAGPRRPSRAAGSGPGTPPACRRRWTVAACRSGWAGSGPGGRRSWPPPAPTAGTRPTCRPSSSDRSTTGSTVAARLATVTQRRSSGR